MNITQIQLNIKDIYTNLCECLYDIYIHDAEPDAEFHVLAKLANANDLISLFKDGYTCMMVGDAMARIEMMNENDMPFIIVVTKNEEIFAVVNGKDVNY